MTIFFTAIMWIICFSTKNIISIMNTCYRASIYFCSVWFDKSYFNIFFLTVSNMISINIWTWDFYIRITNCYFCQVTCSISSIFIKCYWNPNKVTDKAFPLAKTCNFNSEPKLISIRPTFSKSPTYRISRSLLTIESIGSNK